MCEGSSSEINVDIDALPRSVDLVRGPDGAAAFTYLDERLLPYEERFETTSDWRVIVDAIKTLAVRGAPAIGIAGAAALAVWASKEGARSAAGHGCACDRDAFFELMDPVADEVRSARPTAVNLMWAVDRMRRFARQAAASSGSSWEIADAMVEEVLRMEDEDIASNRAIGAYGAELLGPGTSVLTHCNAGQLATTRYGTALAPIHLGRERGWNFRVFCDETRPLLQGARLSAYELMADGVDTTVICDNMASQVMKNGWVDAVLVGADRIAANGDACNKIGTSGVAILARHYGVPFYVLAPLSTIDRTLATGAEIPIEERRGAEITEMWYASPMAPSGVKTYNPAFDVTDASLITGIVTEKGVLRPDYRKSIEEAFRG